MKKLLKLIKNVRNRHLDKILHFLFCYGVAFTVAHLWKIEAGVGIAVLTGVWIEFLDKHLDGDFSIGDIIADVLGIATAYVFFII